MYRSYAIEVLSQLCGQDDAGGDWLFHRRLIAQSTDAAQLLAFMLRNQHDSRFRSDRDAVLVLLTKLLPVCPSEVAMGAIRDMINILIELSSGETFIGCTLAANALWALSERKRGDDGEGKADGKADGKEAALVSAGASFQSAIVEAGAVWPLLSLIGRRESDWVWDEKIRNPTHRPENQDLGPKLCEHEALPLNNLFFQGVWPDFG